MRRRDFVKAMMAASVSANAMLGQQPPPPSAVAPAPPPPVAPGPTPWMHGLMEVKPLPITPLAPDAVAETNAHFFTDRQLASLRRLSEIFMPPSNGYPGAAEAGTAEFLDFLIGVSPSDRQQMYRSGLDRLEADTRRQFSGAFATASPEQADQLIRPWLRTWMENHPPTDPHARFVNLAHSDIREATVNSQAWSDAARLAGRPSPNTELYWYPVDPDLRRNLPSAGEHPPIRRQPS
jgi:hypothetical protein